jgi:predicted RNase H-like HicB family nuclease
MKKTAKNIYNYSVFFEKNELGGYTVTVPALPGLVTQGDTLDHARDMVTEAIECYLEGLSKSDIPVESSEVFIMRIPVTA